MNRSDFKKKISNQWGALSNEHRVARDLVEKADKWDNYQYEKFGPAGLHKKEKKMSALSCPPDSTRVALRGEDLGNLGQQQKKESWLPKDNDVFRITWSYMFARAGWIFMAYTTMFLFLGLLFVGMYMVMR